MAGIEVCRNMQQLHLFGLQHATIARIQVQLATITNNLTATLQQLAAGNCNNYGKTPKILQQLQNILQQ